MQSNYDFVYVVFGGASLIRRNAVGGRATEIVKAVPDFFLKCGVMSSDAFMSSDINKVVTFCCEVSAGFGAFKYCIKNLPF